MTTITYLEDPYELVEAPVARRNGLLPGQSQDSYGRKITTDHKVKLPNGKLYRVYATCYSNAASHWVIVGGKKLFLR